MNNLFEIFVRLFFPQFSFGSVSVGNFNSVEECDGCDDFGGKVYNRISPL